MLNNSDLCATCNIRNQSNPQGQTSYVLDFSITVLAYFTFILQKLCISFLQGYLHFFSKRQIIMKIEFHQSLVSWTFHLHQRKSFEHQGILEFFFSVFCSRQCMSHFFFFFFKLHLHLKFVNIKAKNVPPVFIVSAMQ